MLVHEVRIPPDTRLGRLLGMPSLRVNSMHHQGIKEVADGLRPNAFAPDGLVEGLESPNGNFLVGVQWHPEALAERDPVMRRLFAAFLEAAAA
jgi:putative glutamine amidotransferase